MQILSGLPVETREGVDPLRASGERECTKHEQRDDHTLDLESPSHPQFTPLFFQLR